MTTPIHAIPLPLVRRPMTEGEGGGPVPVQATPCADHGRCDRAACAHAERVVRQCPSPDDGGETPL